MFWSDGFDGLDLQYGVEEQGGYKGRFVIAGGAEG
jgi:hypothetical protein